MSFPGDPAAEDGPLWSANAPAPDRPLLVTGLRGWGLLAGDSEFSWTRETRGAPFDWAGVYVQGVRLAGAWRLTLVTPQGTVDLPSTLARIVARRSGVESLHRAEGLEIVQTVTVPPELRGLARQLAIRSTTGADVALTLRSRIRPVISPILVEGLEPPRYLVQSYEGAPRLRALGASLFLTTSHAPSSVSLDGRPWKGGSYRRPVHQFEHELPLVAPASGSTLVTLFLWGGLDQSLADASGGPPGELTGCARWPAEAASTWRLWERGTPRLHFPDAPELEAGYSLARSALRALYCHTVPDQQGLRAGYPWYADIWGRDLAWMLPAVLWMNDAPWAEGALRTVFAYQSPARLPLLAAEIGELPMQLSPGPVFLYGTSDTSLYYFERVRRLASHTGDLHRIAEEFRAPLELLSTWFVTKTDPVDGLVRNGGEIEGMRDAMGSAGRISFGIDSPDTTIWDAADRRDHAVDLQVLAHDAELARAELWPAWGDAAEGEKALEHAEGLVALLRRWYRWPEEGYLADSVRHGGEPVRRIRPNALLAASAGMLPPEEALGLVRRAAREDLTTPWGIRTLSSRDPRYDPGSYHEGQVWPIATAWGAAAALAVGEVDLGAQYLRTLAQTFLSEGGLANECYRGDRPDPWNSCCLLGFSVGPFLTTLFEGLWGLRPELQRDRLSVRPAFPAQWRSASLDNLRLGAGSLGLSWAPGELVARWEGSRPLVLSYPGGVADLAPGLAQRLELPRT
jgi:hypothetical protein